MLTLKKEKIDGPFQVYVGLISTGYLHTRAIDQIIHDGIAFCNVQKGLETFGTPSVLLKPDLSNADSKYAQHAYTHPEIVRSTLQELFRASKNCQVEILAEPFAELEIEAILKNANGNSERFRGHGYLEFERLYPNQCQVLRYNSIPHVKYLLSKGEDSPLNLKAPDKFFHSDYFVYCPKIKSRFSDQGLSGALALGNQKYGVPMLEICNPDLIISDGITVSVGGGSLTSKGQEIGFILISNNAVAHDWVAAQILGFDPEKNPNLSMLKQAIDAGWGPSHFAEIHLGGAGIEGVRELTQKTKVWVPAISTSIQGLVEKFDNLTSPSPMQVFFDSSRKTDEQTLFGDWLSMTIDAPGASELVKKWPPFTVMLDPILSYPTNKIVFLVGPKSIANFEKLVSRKAKVFSFLNWFLQRFTGKTQISIVQLKNGSKHTIVEIPELKLKEMIAAFLVGSFGRIGSHLFRFLWRMKKVERQAPVATIQTRSLIETKSDFKLKPTPLSVMTSKMPRNKWWAQELGENL
ncbi:MAG: hypothetical protein AB7F43_10290 [Bacteriovoracia bacterium]